MLMRDCHILRRDLMRCAADNEGVEDDGGWSAIQGIEDR